MDPKAHSTPVSLLLSLRSNKYMLDTCRNHPSLTMPVPNVAICCEGMRVSPTNKKGYCRIIDLPVLQGDKQGAHPEWDLMALHSPLYLIGCNRHRTQSGGGHIIFACHLCKVSEVLGSVRGQPCTEPTPDSSTLSSHGAWGWQRPCLLFRRSSSRRSLSACWISLSWHNTTNSSWEQREWFPLALLDPSGLDSN